MPNERARILVIDDDLAVKTLLARYLTLKGYTVETASDGKEGLEKITKEKFPLVICDVRMPQMGGMEVLNAVKKMDPSVEVIFATGYGTIELAVDAMSKEAYGFVQKPLDLDTLSVLIKNALEKNQIKTMLAIYEASKAIFASIKLNVLLPIIMQLSLRILKADDASIFIVGADGRLTLAESAGLDTDTRRKVELGLGDRVAGKVAEWREPIIIAGPLEGDPRFRDVHAFRHIKSSIVCPIVIGEEVLGVLNINRIKQDHPFNEFDLRNITILGSQIAQAVYNAKLYTQLERKIDELNNASKEIEETQYQLIQSEKLAAIGQLATGVAHELNTPLTSITGFTQLLLREDLPPQQRKDLETIRHQSECCSEIVQNLLKFSRKSDFQKEPVEIRPLIEAALYLVKHDFHTEGIEVRLEIPENLPRLQGDPCQLQQLFLNLIVNAKQAMEGKGSGALILRASRGTEKVLVQFEDNGWGISKENLSRIFNPFFTTKPPGKGTGLGLSISYGIVQRHGGNIRVESQVGIGSIFTVELPI
jgi:signal transduction histidine kinase/CheY-like chemotaxis protein